MCAYLCVSLMGVRECVNVYVRERESVCDCVGE